MALASSLRLLRLGVLASVVLLAGAMGIACTDSDPDTATETPSTATTVTPDATADATRTTSNARDNSQIEGALDISDVVAEVGDSVVLIESVGGGLGAGVSGSGVV